MIQFPTFITSRFPQSGHEFTPSLMPMSLYSIAADLFEFTDRIERSRSVDELTARASTARDSPHREPRTRGDLELPKIFPSEENPTEQAPTLDILADCLEHIHQIRYRTRLASTFLEQPSLHTHCRGENELDGNTKKIAHLESFRSTKWNRISDGEHQRAAVARQFPHQHDSRAVHEWSNPSSSRSSTRKSDGLQEHADIAAVEVETIAEFECEADNWNANVGATASPHEHQGFAARFSPKEVARRVDIGATVEKEDDRGEKTTVNDSEFTPRCDTDLQSFDDHQFLDGHDAHDDTSVTEKGRTNPETRRSADPPRETAGRMVNGASGAIDSPRRGSRVSAASSLRFETSGNETSAVNNSRDNGGVHCLSSVSFEETSGARDGDPRKSSRLALTNRKSNLLAHTGAPRTKTVRFLLGDNRVGEKIPARLNPHGPFSMQAVVDDKHKICWTCAGCGKKNGEGSVLCSVCGRRGNTSHTANSHSNSLLSKDQTRFRHVETSRAPQALRTVCERSVSRGRPASPRRLERIEMKDSLRRDGAAGYDLSSFARMKQTTEKAVTARLSLREEIKSLLSLVRG